MENVNIIDLNVLRDSIEKLESLHQSRIFQIIKKAGIEYTENGNGIFINMSLLKKKTLQEINKYILYVNLQKQQLSELSKKKELYKRQFYGKDIKDKGEVTSLEEQ